MKTITAITVLTVMAVSPVLAQQPQMYDDRPKITVTGEAVVNVEPDKIVATFGIETSDMNVLTAKEKNNGVLKAAFAEIEALGIPQKDIQTDQLSIEPRYDSDYSKRSFIGHFVRNTFVVTLSDTAKVEELVTKMLESGVNYIHGIDFQTTKFKEYREQARTLALTAAREKADKMAAVLGQTVGSPIQINENYRGSNWGYYSSWSPWGYGRGQGMAQNVIQDIPAESEGTAETIALGKIAIRASVSVTFELTH
jgi:hypothetical protein